MDIKRLQYFLAVAEEGQITKAAQTLHMAQPPLSQQLKLLETELGVPLIDRCGSRKISLTTAGQALRSRAEQILELINQTEKEVRDVGEGIQGTLSMGLAIPWGITVGSSFLLKKVDSFHKCYPKINFQLWEGDTCRIEDLLTNRVIEMAITKLPANLDNYETITLPPEPVAAAFTPKWYNDLSTNSISLATLADKPLIVHRKYEKRLLKYFQQLGLKPRILCTHDDVRSMLLWANAGLGVAFVQMSAENLIPNSNLLFKKVVEPTLMTRTLSGIWQKDCYLSAAARHFIDLLKQDNGSF
jgi:DNA-binding transcriptional LysR family regulator